MKNCTFDVFTYKCIIWADRQPRFITHLHQKFVCYFKIADLHSAPFIVSITDALAMTDTYFVAYFSASPALVCSCLHS